MCVANSARSQMAEGLARKILGASANVQSAGTKATHLNPFAVKVMKEVGIDISSQKSKSVDTIDPKTVDTVITLCAEEVCPVYLGEAKRLHWPFPDPVSQAVSEEEQLQKFRTTRDEIQIKLEEFKRSLGIK